MTGKFRIFSPKIDIDALASFHQNVIFLEKIRLLPQCGVQGSAWKMGSCACWNTYYWPHFPTTQRVVKASSCQEHFQIRPYFAQLAGMIAQSNATLRAKRSKKKRKSERPALTHP